MQTFALTNVNYPVGCANTDGIYFVLLRHKTKTEQSMKLQFNLEYQTTFGEELVLSILGGKEAEQYKMTTLDGLHWTCELNRSALTSPYVDYFYSVWRGGTSLG